MQRFFIVLFSVIGWGLLLGYLIVAGRHCSRKQDETMIREVRVTVRDSATLQVVTPRMVRGWLEKEGVKTKEIPLEEVEVSRARRIVESHPFVRHAKVFTGLNGVLHVELTQRHPVARVQTSNGYRFYISDDGYILPLPAQGTMHVPIVTGHFTPPFAPGYAGSLEDAVAEPQKKLSENYLFLCKLINFVTFIGKDDFWRAEIVQINVRENPSPTGDPARQEPQVEFVPRAGNHLVVLGTLDDVPRKLDKLLRFYRQALDHEGWNGPKIVNLSYENQVICTK